MPLVAYESDEEEHGEHQHEGILKTNGENDSFDHEGDIPRNSHLLMNAAPSTGATNRIFSSMLGESQIAKVDGSANLAEPSSAVLAKRSIGPENPYLSRAKRQRNMVTGRIDSQAFDDAMFKIQERTFQQLGYARTELNEIVGNQEQADNFRGMDITELRKNRDDKSARKRDKGDAGVMEGKSAYIGPWAKFSESESESSEGGQEVEEEEKEELKEEFQASQGKPATEEPSEVSSGEAEGLKLRDTTEYSTFEGSSEYDYQGRTYMHVPQDLGYSLNKDAYNEVECQVPRTDLPKHTWAGHSGGVRQIQYFPKHGHLLLSSGNDSVVKLWDVYHERELLRTYHGHARAVKAIDFSPDGRRFLSTSYDGTIKLWDTETGQCISRYLSGRGRTMANCVRFNPRHPDSFVAGMSDRKILQFDMRGQERGAEEPTQVYDHHLAAVNTLTFVDNDFRFMSTSDDKTVRVWDWQVNVPIKYIADPAQQSMPAVARHPGGKYVALQSLDNRIVVFGATDRFRAYKKKNYAGFSGAGNQVGLDISPDGSFLVAGDSNGYVIMWDWKTCTIKRKYKAHEGLVTCVATHPQESTYIATAGRDGPIHLWV